MYVQCTRVQVRYTSTQVVYTQDGSRCRVSISEYFWLLGEHGYPHVMYIHVMYAHTLYRVMYHLLKINIFIIFTLPAKTCIYF